MTTEKNEHQDIDNQDIEMNGDFAGENCRIDREPEPSDNMAEGTDAVSADAPEAPQELTPQEEAAIWKDKYMRLSAEYENYRKRTFKEKLDLIAAGGEDVVRSMLEVLDDMDRALAAMAKTDDMEAVKQGIELIDTKLRNTLKNKGLAEIEAIGGELDTDLHEAVARIEVEEKKMKGKIIDVVQKGYKLKEKIIRYAKVVVGQ